MCGLCVLLLPLPERGVASVATEVIRSIDHLSVFTSFNLFWVALYYARNMRGKGDDPSTSILDVFSNLLNIIINRYL